MPRNENIVGVWGAVKGQEYERFGYGVERIVEDHKHENIVYGMNIQGLMLAAPPLRVNVQLWRCCLIVWIIH